MPVARVAAERTAPGIGYRLGMTTVRDPETARPTAPGRASAPITGVARGGLGTAANLEDTQLYDLEELGTAAPATALEPPPAQPASAPAQAVPVVAQRAPVIAQPAHVIAQTQPAVAQPAIIQPVAAPAVVPVASMPDGRPTKAVLAGKTVLVRPDGYVWRAGEVGVTF